MNQHGVEFISQTHFRDPIVTGYANEIKELNNITQSEIESANELFVYSGELDENKPNDRTTKRNILSDSLQHTKNALGSVVAEEDRADLLIGGGIVRHDIQNLTDTEPLVNSNKTEHITPSYDELLSLARSIIEREEAIAWIESGLIKHQQTDRAERNHLSIDPETGLDIPLLEPKRLESIATAKWMLGVHKDELSSKKQLFHNLISRASSDIVKEVEQHLSEFSGSRLSV